MAVFGSRRISLIVGTLLMAQAGIFGVSVLWNRDLSITEIFIRLIQVAAAVALFNQSKKLFWVAIGLLCVALVMWTVVFFEVFTTVPQSIEACVEEEFKESSLNLKEKQWQCRSAKLNYILLLLFWGPFVSFLQVVLLVYAVSSRTLCAQLLSSM
jgi:hypothetical protein